MGQVFAAFGIDWRLLIVNIVNFGILLLALLYFLYAPLLRILEERKQKVAQSVIDADAAKDALAEIQNSRAEVLSTAGKEADTMLASARAAASAREREIVAQAEAAAASVLRDAEAQAKEAKAQAIAESKQEVAKLIVLGMEKAMSTK